MPTFTTKTGLGYIREDATGDIVARCEFAPDSEHPLKDGYTFVEVPDKTVLDAVTVYVPPAVKTPEQIIEEKIQAEMRVMAEERLRARGEIYAGPAQNN